MSSVAWPAIEERIRSRQMRLARSGIQGFLRARREDPESIYLACDGYRRLGLFRQGLRLLKPEQSPGSPRAALWTARFLNLLGASEFALQLLTDLPIRCAEEHQIAGNIFLTQFRYDDAARHLEAMREAQKEPAAYSSRFALLALSDAWQGQGRHEEALELVSRLYTESRSRHSREEDLFQAICLGARGEYLARQGNLDEARVELRKAWELHPKEDRSPDFGFLCKWLAFVEDAPVRRSELFEQALFILHRPTLRPEAWLDVYRLKAAAGTIEPDEEWGLRCYPVFSDGFRRTLPPTGQFTALCGSRVSRGAPRIHLDLSSDEWFFRGQARLGIPKELRLVALAGLAGDWGLNIERAKCLLWPDEARSYLQLEDRLKKLMARARERHGIDLRSEDGWIRLRENSRHRLAVTLPSREAAKPSLLMGRSDFSSAEARGYYGLSATQCAEHIRRWRERGWIEAVGKSPRIRYRVR